MPAPGVEILRIATDKSSATRAWRGDCLHICNQDLEEIFCVPLEFARKGGLATYQGVGDVLDLVLDDGIDRPLQRKRKIAETTNEYAGICAEDEIEGSNFLIYRSDC